VSQLLLRAIAAWRFARPAHLGQRHPHVAATLYYGFDRVRPAYARLDAAGITRSETHR
jgi:hypothetical protein